MKIFYWSPFISYVATTYAVINSIVAIKKFSKKKIDISLINAASEWDDYIEKIEKENIKLIELKKKKINFKNFPKGNFIKSRVTYFIVFFKTIFQLHRLLKEEKPEYLVIHLLSFIPMTLLLFFSYKTKFILRVSGYPKLNFLRKIFWKIMNKKIYKVFCPTHLTKELLVNKKIFNKNKVFLVKDPIIEVNILREKMKKSNLNTLVDKRYILSIGRLTNQKNFNFLINAFCEIRKKDPDLNLVICGNGEKKEDLLNLISQLKLEDKVKLIGFKDNIFPILKGAEFFVLTSNWEDPGFVIIEAMFTKKIVLTSDCPNGPKNIINDGVNGFKFKTNNKEDFLKKFDEVSYLYSNEKNKVRKILFNGIKTSRLYSLFNHYKDISNHLV